MHGQIQKGLMHLSLALHPCVSHQKNAVIDPMNPATFTSIIRTQSIRMCLANVCVVSSPVSIVAVRSCQQILILERRFNIAFGLSVATSQKYHRCQHIGNRFALFRIAGPWAIEIMSGMRHGGPAGDAGVLFGKEHHRNSSSENYLLVEGRVHCSTPGTPLGSQRCMVTDSHLGNHVQIKPSPI